MLSDYCVGGGDHHTIMAETEAVGRAEAEARAALEAEYLAAMGVLAVKERDGLHDVHGREYRRQLDNPRSSGALVVRPQAQAALDGYCGAWRKQYRQFLTDRLTAKGKWRERQEDRERVAMSAADAASRPFNAYYHAVRQLLADYRDRWGANLAARSADLLERVSAQRRSDAAQADIEASLRHASDADRRAVVESSETANRADIAFDEGSARERIERQCRSGSAELLNRAAAVVAVIHLVLRQETAARELVWVEEESAVFAAFELGESSHRQALVEAPEAASRSDITDFFIRHRAVVDRRAGLVDELRAVADRQAKARAGVLWAEQSVRSDIVAARRAYGPQMR